MKETKCTCQCGNEHMTKENIDTCIKCDNPLTMYYCVDCEQSSEQETCLDCGKTLRVDKQYHNNCA